MHEGMVWVDALRRYLAQKRAEQPVPLRDSLSPILEAKYGIQQEALSQALREGIPRLRRFREALHKREGFRPPLVIVVITDWPGLVAMDELCPFPREDLIPALHDEFYWWLEGHNDPDLRWYASLWSLVGTPSASVLARARERYPIPPGNEYWIHRGGINGGGGLVETTAHLYEWDGSAARLLDDRFA